MQQTLVSSFFTILDLNMIPQSASHNSLFFFFLDFFGFCFCDDNTDNNSFSLCQQLIQSTGHWIAIVQFFKVRNIRCLTIALDAHWCSSILSTRGSIGAPGTSPSGCLSLFIVFFKACLLLQNQTRTTSRS